MSQPHEREIWITGAAAVTALGDTIAATWGAILAARTAGRWVELRMADGRAVRVPAAPVENGLLKGIPLESSCQRADRMALEVAREALASARLVPEHLAEASVVFCSSKPAMGSWSPGAARDRQLGGQEDRKPGCSYRTSLALDVLAPHRTAALIADALGTGGPILSSVAACSTGLHGLIRAVQWLRDGGGSLAVTGAVESCLNPFFAAGFRQMRVLAVGRDDPATACRPFDRKRSGFVIGEGAGALILEAARHARARNAPPVAVIAGYGLGADPTGLTELDPEGVPMASTIRRCLSTAAVRPNQIAWIKAHGTGTVQNDESEAAAIACVFGRHPPPVVSLKSHLGHTLGASGAIETALVARSIEAGVIPGCANLTWPDPACGPNHPVAPVPIVRGSVKHVLCLSAGFGGHLAALLVRSANDADFR
jgi:3-oxoacyl-[acyl-carrier-protein] synthase II